MSLKCSLFGSCICFLANSYEVFIAITKYFTFGSHICSLYTYDNLCIPCYAHILYFPYLCQYLLKLYTHVYIQNTNAHDVLSRQPKLFYLCKPHVFLHIYDLFCIPCFWHSYLFLAMSINFSLQFINISHMATIFVFNVILLCFGNVTWCNYVIVM